MRIPPGPIDPTVAEELTRLTSQIEKLLEGRWACDHTMDVEVRDGTPVLRANIPQKIEAKITGKLTQAEAASSAGEDYDSSDTYTDEDSCKYSFVEVLSTPDGCTPTEVLNGRKGFTDLSPAVEISGRTDVAEGTITELWLSRDGTHWRFTPGGGGGGLILDVVTCVSILSADFETYSDGTTIPV